MIAWEYLVTSSWLGANMRAATSSRPVRVMRRLRMPPVRDLKSEYGVMMTYASAVETYFILLRILNAESRDAAFSAQGWFQFFHFPLQPLTGFGSCRFRGGSCRRCRRAAADALPPKILNITVPQVGHLPLMALRPFFIVSSTASTISFLALHLTQYPSGIKFFRAEASCDRAVMERSLGGGPYHRQQGKGRKTRRS